MRHLILTLAVLRIEQRLDNRGERIDNHLHRCGARIDRHFDRHPGS